jgi:hypothetical protein
METLVSMSLVFLMVVMALGIVITIGTPTINSAAESLEIKNAQDDMRFIDTYIRSAAAEGRDATRVYKFSSPKTFESIPGEGAVQFSKDVQSNYMEYMTRTYSGNLLSITGSNVDCYETSEYGIPYLVAENDKVKAYFRKISGQIDSGNVLAKIVQKTNNVTIFFGNSSVVIDNDPSVAVGTGYTEISFPGTRRPLCQIRAFVDSTMNYDIYYKLYAGADFLVVEVRNIR